VELLGVREDEPDGLWSMSRVPDRNWKAAMTPKGSGHAAIPDYNKFFDSMVERIDLRSGSVLATLRVDPMLAGFLGRDQAWFYREDEAGNPRLEIVRFRFRR